MQTMYAAMNDGDVTAVAGKAIWVTLQLGGPVLIVGLIIGLVVSIFQAVTQIQEQTLSFIPKVLGLVVVIVVAGPWMLEQILAWTTELYGSIPSLVGA